MELEEQEDWKQDYREGEGEEVYWNEMEKSTQRRHVQTRGRRISRNRRHSSRTRQPQN
jgi:hypothetical protein